MSDLPNVSSLVHRVLTRLRVSAIARSFYIAFVAVSVVYLVLLLVSRLTGLIAAEWMTWQTTLVVPPVALLLAVLFHRRPNVSDSARHIDQHAHAKDLFLTVARLDVAAGGYQDLVRQDAESKSQGIQPAKVVPFRWQRRAGRLLVACVVLGVALLTPQFDPFGKVEAAEAKTRAIEELKQSQKATVARAEKLKKDREDAEGQTETEKELRKLTDALKKMRPGKANKDKQAKILIDRKTDISKQHNLKNTKQLREMLSKQMADQNFGGQTSQKAKEWMKALKEGKADKLVAEINQLQKELKELAETKDPAERAKKARELKKKMQDMANFASDKANSKQLAQAIQRAMEQMEAGRENEQISEEAMKAAMESLELSKMETENLAQAAKELKQLEQALEAIQAARKLNDQERLDGSEMEGVDSIEDYAELYREMMGEDGERGPGGNGEGQGEGGPPAEEDDSTKTGFKKEESKQELQAGKNLLSWKTKGMSEAGEFKKDVAQSIRTVKQGVSEAIKKEEVPPGYVDGIKKYFDNIEETIDEPAGNSATEKSNDNQN